MSEANNTESIREESKYMYGRLKTANTLNTLMQRSSDALLIDSDDYGFFEVFRKDEHVFCIFKTQEYEKTNFCNLVECYQKIK